jgi:hypothetical protein
MITHNAETEYLYEKQVTEFFYNIDQLIFFHIAEGKTVWCRARHDMISCLFPTIDQSACPGHLNLPPFYNFHLFLILLIFKIYERIFIAKYKEPVPFILWVSWVV